jgi:hypothetical protein
MPNSAPCFLSWSMVRRSSCNSCSFSSEVQVSCWSRCVMLDRDCSNAATTWACQRHRRKTYFQSMNCRAQALETRPNVSSQTVLNWLNPWTTDGSLVNFRCPGKFLDTLYPKPASQICILFEFKIRNSDFRVMDYRCY